jgi:hypothetical protein
MRDTADAPFVVTIVVDTAVTALDALEVIAFAADARIEREGSAYPRVGLAPDAWAEVHIPKFADPPPLAIDVCSGTSLAVATHHAELLAASLQRLGWRISRPR